PGRWRIDLRPNPDRRALVHVEAGELWCDLGDDLHRARAGADDRGALACQLDGMVPRCRVQDRSCKRAESGNRCRLRIDERADRADDEARRELAIWSLQAPQARGSVPRPLLDLAAEADLGTEIICFD